MKLQIRRAPHLAFCIALVSFLQVRMVQAQPVFPDPDILYEQTHEGDLVLTGSQVMTIENTHYKINGDVVLQDSAQLIARQSIIELVGPHKAAIRLQGSSKLQADTTIFGGADASGDIDPAEAEMLKGDDMIVDEDAQVILNNCFSQTQSYMGNSQVVVRNSFLIQEPLGITHIEGNTDVLIEDSVVGAFWLPIPENIPVTIDSLHPGYLENWSARESISDSLTYNLVLRRTEINDNDEGYKGGLEMGWNISIDALNTMITISNSKLNRLIISFPPGEPASISDLVTLQPTNFHLNDIHLINTEVQTQWGVFMNGDHAEIFDSEGLFIFMTGGDADIFVANSEVSEIDPRNYTGTLIYENSIWLGGYEIFDSSYIDIRGSVRMLPTVPIFDETSTMTRYYDVYLLDDSDGSPFPDINLSLSKEDTLVWNGTTDNDGKVTFDITFDINNFEKEWILKADADHINLAKVFSIRISNPVKISLELEEDGVHYRPVIHVAPYNLDFPFGTRESPYPAIQEAIDNSGGDIIYVHPGTYPGYVAPGETRGGITLKDDVTIFGAGADSTFLTGDVYAEGASDMHISGFTIEDGIHALSSSMTLTNSVIADFTNTAIFGLHSHFQIINNVLTGNGGDAIFLEDSSTAIIKNNIIVNNLGYGINGVESASASIDYNDVWANGENYFEFFPAGEHDISAPPMFLEPGSGNFHLHSESPCKDAGDPDTLFNDPDGSRNDMGAFGGPYAPPVISGLEEQDKAVPHRYALYQNYPNPFNSQTKIGFDLPESAWVRLSIYNILGQKVRTLVNEKKKAGHHTISWDGKNGNHQLVGNGVYLYQFRANNYSKTNKAVLLK